MKTAKSYGIKALSLVLSLLMVLSVLPVSVVGVNAQTPATGTYTVIACSDYQYPNTDSYGIGATGNSGGEIVVKNILSAINDEGISSADGFICAGDYDYDLGGESGTTSGITSLNSALADSDVDFSGAQKIFVQGNHDPQSTAGGTTKSGNNDPDNGAYGVYLINERDYMWSVNGIVEQTIKQAAENLRRYFNSKIAVNYTAPIFVVSHLPLHYSMRTNNDGDGMYANYIFDVVNEAGAQGLNIIYLYGHDHSNGWDDYLGGSKVYLAKGEEINIAQSSKTVYETETLNFIYMNAGFTGYYENHNTSTGTQSTSYDISDLTMTSFVITGDDVEIARYDNSGKTVLKKSGVYNYYKSEQNKDYSPNTDTVSSAQTVTLTEVTDTSYELSPVVEVSAPNYEGTTSVAGTYTAIASYSDLEDGETYLITAKRDSKIYAAATQYTSNSSYSSNRLESLLVNPSDDLNEGSEITEDTCTATGGGTLSITACEWIYTGGTFVPATGENAGKYIRIPNSTSGAITFSSTAATYTVGSTFKETGYLNLRSNYLYSSYTSGTSLTYFKKTSSGAESTWTNVGSVTTASATPNTTPDSGLYTTSGSAATEDNCYTLTKSGNTYTVENMSGEYMNIASNGTVTWTSTAQSLTLVSDNSSNITAKNSSGVTATSVLNGVKLYSASTYTISGGTTYTYTLDTDGIDSGSSNTYLIVGATSNYMLTHSTTTVNATAVTVTNNTITLSDNTSDWYFTSSTSGNIRDDDSSYYLKVPSSDGGSLTASTSATTLNFKTASASSGLYYMYYEKSSGSKSNYFGYYSSGWKAYKAGTSTTSPGTTYAVRLFKLTNTETLSAGTGYTAGEQFTTEVGSSTTVNHYIYYNNNPINVTRGNTSENVDNLIRTTSESTLQYSEYSDGSNATAISLSTADLTFAFTDITLDVAGSYSVPVYYYDSTADSPVKTLVGYQTVNVSSSGAITSAELDTNDGYVYYNAKSGSKTGANIVLTYSDGSTSRIPVTVGMLLDYSGNKNALNLCSDPGDYEGLGVFYDYLNGYWFDNFTLHVQEAEDYPEYPNEGSVKVGKSATAPTFQNDGVAKVEITATGVPMNPGIDIVLMVDASSSMEDMTGEYTNSDGETIEVFGTSSSGGTWYDANGNELDISTSSVTNKSTRLVQLQTAVTDLLAQLSTPNSTTGIVPDIKMAIGQFNGYGSYETGDSDSLSFVDEDNDHLTGTTCRDNTGKGAVLTGTCDLTAGAFEEISALSSSFNASSEITSDSGTNYDFAFEYMYDLIAAKQAENEANGENRQVLAIFMSDGAPFKYNYFSSQSGASNWNDWLQGTYDSYTDVDSSSSNTYFYNGKGNSHRTADAIKGDPETDYVVIDKMCTEGTVDVTGDGEVDPYMTTVKGLGVTMYSVGFCLTVDSAITVESMNYVLENIASDEDKYFIANSGTQLNDAFADIADQTVQAGTEAYYIDTMGPAYDIQLGSTYVKNGVTYNLTDAPTMTVTNYTVYTTEDYKAGVDSITYDEIGKRTGASEVIETVTFNTDGTQAYSSIIGTTTNILVNGVITAKNFIYNSNSTAVLIDKDGDGIKEYSLAAESFYWKMGIIPDTEFALSYYVYLTGSMEGERAAGSYPTNTSAILYYKNYLDNDCHKDTVSPILPWEAATVSYEFYLVNADGQPVNSAGEVIPFENRILIGNRQTDTILLNSTATETAYTVSASANIPEGYTLFNPSAEYAVTIDSNLTSSTAVITDTGKTAVTTYYYSGADSWKGNGTVPSSKVSNYASTSVAFGVVLKLTIIPDTVIIDYGLPVKIHALANDLGLPTATVINSISTTVPSALNTGLAQSEVAKASTLSMENGNVALSEDAKFVVYTPKNATMGDEEVFYYEVYASGSYYYGKITVIPATKIYYEEDFFTFTDGSSGCKWSIAGEEYENVFQAEDRPGTFSLGTYDANNNYGRDTAYDASTATYSLGSAMSATVDASTLGKEPKAEFTFCGTGFELFSVTTNKSGTLLVKVESLTTGITYNKTYIVNTYYGYAYGRLYIDGKDGTNTKATLSSAYTVNGETFNNVPLYETDYEPGVVHPEADEIIITVNSKVYSNIDHSTDSVSYDYAYGWLLESGEDVEERGLYQVPVVTIPDANGSGIDIAELAYGTYKVTVTPKYSKTFDKTGCGEYTVVIDGIRVINPAGKGDDISEVVSAAYEKDAESNPQYTEIRDDVIADTDNFLKTVATDENSTVGGAIFIDGITALGSGIEEALNKYKEAGPNNEMYLYDGQAIAFKPEITSCLAAPSSFQLGMKVTADGETDGAEATVKVIISDDEDSKIRGIHTISVKGSAEQFYNLSSYLSWTEDAEIENRYISKYTVVILNDSDAVVSLTSFKWTFRNSDVSVESESPTVSLASGKSTLEFAEDAIMSVYDTVDTSDVTLSWVTDTLETGAIARLEIITSQKISSITIDNTEITEYNDLNNGQRQWIYEFTVTENSDSTYDVVLKDSRGRVSETLTTDALTVEQQEDAETEEGAFAKLTAVLKHILELIKKVIGWWDNK